MSTALKTGKLDFKTKFGYSLGQVGDSLAYNIFLVFFFFFLTEIAGVSPAHSGFISLIVILWDAITDPIIGYLSDNLKSKFGRRRPFIIAGAIPLGLLIFLAFTAVDFSASGKFVYYTIVAILFWTAYTMVDIPYYSLGAEITQDFDERTHLRIWGSAALWLAVAVTGFAPMMATILGGGDDKLGWSLVGAVVGGGALLFDLLSWRATRGKEVSTVSDTETVREKFNVFKTYLQALKLKPMKYVVGANFFYLFGQAISIGINLHIMIYVVPLSDPQITIYYTAMALFSIAFLPLINFTTNKLGKKKAFILLNGIPVVGIAIFYFINLYSFSSLMIYGLIMGLANGAFWTLCYSMAYDNTELDEFIHNMRREGLYVSFMSFSQKVGNAVGLLFLGLILEFFKYNADLDIQPDTAITGLKQLFTLWTALFMGISVLIIIFHPMTKSKFKAIEKALEDRKAGREADTSEFEDLL